MSKYKIIEYDTLKTGIIRVYGSSIIQYKTSTVRNRNTINSFAVMDVSTKSSVQSSILDNMIFHTVSNNDKLYIYPGCKMAREHYRKSGYSIVRNPEAADACIIPDLPDNFMSIEYDIALFNQETKTLELLLVYYGSRGFIRLTQNSDRYQDSLDALKARFGDTLISDDSKSQYCTFVPNKLNYKDIILDSFPDRYYATESSVKIESSLNISVETLDLWSRYPSSDLLMKTICQSDWRIYPVTLLCFLYRYRNKIDLYKMTSDFKYVIDTIGYNYNLSLRANLRNRIIEPEDWNMLQAWLMHLFEVDPKGGFTNCPKYRSAIDDLMMLCKHKMCVAPLIISSPMTIETLSTLTK